MRREAPMWLEINRPSGFAARRRGIAPRAGRGRTLLASLPRFARWQKEEARTARDAAFIGIVARRRLNHNRLCAKANGAARGEAEAATSASEAAYRLDAQHCSGRRREVSWRKRVYCFHGNGKWEDTCAGWNGARM